MLYCVVSQNYVGKISTFDAFSLFFTNKKKQHTILEKVRTKTHTAVKKKLKINSYKNPKSWTGLGLDLDCHF